MVTLGEVLSAPTPGGASMVSSEWRGFDFYGSLDQALTFMCF